MFDANNKAVDYLFRALCQPEFDRYMGTPGSPPTRLTAVPNKWVRPTRRPADLSVGPTDLVGSPHDLLKFF
jgi:hypothetical protein